jgi:rod shape-determining protein MreC
MFRKKHYIALGAVTLLAVLILSLPSRATSHLRLAIGSLFLPLFGLVHTARQIPAEAADAITPRSELLKELDALRRENAELKVRGQQAAATAVENNQLRALVGWARQQPWQLKLANVVMRDPANWWRAVQIDLGSRDGVQTNQPVLTMDGLVGRISSVGATRSLVVLIGDPNCRVSARVQNPARDMGVVGAGGPLNNSLVTLTYLSGGANLKPGQGVVTSGEGGIFPAGIPIGQIVDAWPVQFGLYTEARVKLSADIGALEQVWVLTNPNQQAP